MFHNIEIGLAKIGEFGQFYGIFQLYCNCVFEIILNWGESKS